jgi:ubiquinone/menaquinone biosynthesis C-methylase UbiE
MPQKSNLETNMESLEKETQDWYKNYYMKKGKDRNDLLTNVEVLFQHLAFEESIISALRRATNLNRETSRILDVGCGGAGSLTRFLQLGFSPGNLYGIDLLKDRIDEGRKRYPNLNFICDDATSMPFESDMFDLVLESTMFVQITDEGLSQRISEEMLRVTKRNGYLMLIDWRYGKPGNSNYLAVSTKRINKMFSVGSLSDVVCQESGALVPPVGRAVSKYLPSAYFLLRAIFPFLVGSKTTLLQKRNP